MKQKEPVSNSMTVLEHAYSYGFSIAEARRFRDDEKQNYAEWFREIGMVSLGRDRTVDLPFVSLDDALINDILKRPADGEFLGCSNAAWIISATEKEHLIALNKQNEAKKKAEEIAYLRAKLKELESAKLYTEEEAEAAKNRWNDIQNQGGEGYVPHYPTFGEYESIKNRLYEIEWEAQL